MSSAAPNALQSTAKLYKTVMEDVVSNVREAFLDEGVDEAVLLELKQIWENKVIATKAVETLNPAHHNPSVQSSRNNHHHHHQQAQQHQQLQQQQHHHQQQQQVPIVNVSASHVSHSQPVGQHLDRQQQSNQYGQQTIRPVPLIRHVPMQTGVITHPGLGVNAAAGTTSLPHSVITSAHAAAAAAAGGSLFMQIPTVPVRMLGGPQIPTISAAAAGAMAHKADKSSMPGVSVVPQIDGPSSSCRPKKSKQVVIQLDGPGGLSDDEDDIEEDEPLHEDEDEPAEVPGPVEEGEPLNSEDDVSVENEDEMFDADDVVVCQFEKVNRIRNKWKFILKDGIINLSRKDYVFNRATGEAEF